jgi:hypothetical protein
MIENIYIQQGYIVTLNDAGFRVKLSPSNSWQQVAMKFLNNSGERQCRL